MNPTTHVTFQSPDWHYIKTYCEQALQQQRELLENPETDYRKTLLARGHIKALKSILLQPQQASAAAQGK